MKSITKIIIGLVGIAAIGLLIYYVVTKEKNIIGIEGHRLVGGFRASLYNALPISSVTVLVNAMKEFTAAHA